MMIIKHSSEIKKSPEYIFPWIAEPDKAIKWQKNVKESEIIINSPEIVGTTFKEVIEENCNRLSMNGVITEYIKDKKIQFHLESKIHKLDVEYSLESINTGSKICIDTQINWKFPINILSIFIGSKMKKGIIKQMELEILELKKICEKG